MFRIFFLAAGCLIGAFAVSIARAGSRVEADSCRTSALRDDRLVAVGLRGELVLESGARAILDGIHWPETDDAAGAIAAYLSGFRGLALTVSQRGEVDRWGRARIDAVAELPDGSGEPIELAASLVSAGLAQVDTGESDLLCRNDLLALEAGPRAERRGVWGEDVLDARDPSALGSRAGRFVVAEGRIVGVGERTGRTYLDFVRNSASGLAVTVSKRTWRIMQERGLTAATLKGRFARVRGRLEIRRGPTLDIGSADMIEVPDGERARTR